MTGSRPGARARTPLAALAALALLAAGCGLECPRSDRAIRSGIAAELAKLPEPRGRSPRLEDGDLTPLMRRFYGARGDRPVWVGPRGPEERAHALLALLEEAPARGLDPADYGVRRIRWLLAATDPVLHGPRPHPRTLARLDLALTRAGLALASHLLSGRVNPRAFDPDWHHGGRSGDPVVALEQALAGGDLTGSLAALEPAARDYAGLASALGRYRSWAAAGGWPAVPGGPRLATGQRGERVRRLCRRLLAEGDLDSATADREIYDRGVREAVKRFQRRHGLDTTGVVGAAEFAALAVPAAERASTIALNLERLRWMSDTLGACRAWINIPEFTLRVYEGERPGFETRVVVGADSTRTPCFRAALNLMVVNPYWRIPPKIAASEILEQIRRDTAYLARNSIRVMEGTGKTAREVDPATVRWSKLHAGNFKYRLLQDPGPVNAVGHVKFMCPNPWSVYLHDTPATHLFQRPHRAFSHGCVRVERPLDLARHLLREKPGWDSLRIATAFDSSFNEVVFLPEPVPVHLVYLTAWVDSTDAVQFRDDVYGLDAALAEALRGERPPRGRRAGVSPAAEERARARDSSGALGSQAAGKRDQVSRVAVTAKASER